VFAQDATECLCNHKDIQRGVDASFTLTADANAPEETGDTAQGAGGALVLSPRPGLDHSGLDSAQQNVTMRPDGDSGLTVRDTTFFKDPDFGEEEWPLQASRECTQIIEIQQMSCALAKDVLDHPNQKPTWSWNATEKLHTRESGQDFTVKEASYSTVDTGIYLQKSPEGEGEGSVRHSNPQEHISRHHGDEGDSGQAIDEDGSKSTSSIEDVTETPLTSTSSSSTARHSYGIEHTASQKDESLARTTTLSTPQRSYVSSSQDILPSLPSPSLASSREELPKTDDLHPELPSSLQHSFEVAKFDRLEGLLMAQEEARLERDKAKKRATEEAARAAADAKKKGDEDKLAQLERLILAQKDEQLKREAEASKIAAEKKAAEATASLNVALKEREETAKKAAIELAQKTSAPVLFQDPTGRKFSCPWHLCSTWEVGACFQAPSKLLKTYSQN
jgi:hypothetical protein